MVDPPSPEDFVAEVRRLDHDLSEAADFRERMTKVRLGLAVEPPPELPPVEAEPLGRTHLVIGDSHAKPGVPNYRYEWLARMCLDLRPDVIVDIGDWFDMPSLCHYDIGKKCFEGRRYWKDIAAGWDAQERFRRILQQDPTYQPELHRTVGNHEHRIARIVELEPRFEGLVGLEDLASEEFGWTEHRFLQPFTVDGVSYQHYFDKNGRPPGMGTKHVAATMLANGHSSRVMGHTHRYDHFEEVALHRRITAINCGCYFEHPEEYATKDQQDRWRRGILVLRDVVDGEFDHEFVGMRQIKARYA